jgi:transcriptional regulator with XRE-family HTH domain
MGANAKRVKREFRYRVGARIRARRVAAGLAQSELARLLPGRVEGGQVSRWERGESFPTYANVLALARALGVSEEALLCGAGEEDRPRRRRKAA